MTQAFVEAPSAPTTPAVPDCPFPGLRSFTDEFTRFYFGREAQRDECIRRLQEHRFLAVIGSSGSGKSSLIKSGLWPALERGLLRGAEESWEKVLFQPGPDPLDALARALCGVRARDEKEAGERLLRAHRTLRTSERAVEAILLECLGEERPSILLCVDQFEELFRLGRERQTPERWREDRIHFLHTVLAAREARDLRIYVVTTMRTDFLEDCTNFPELPEALNEGQYLVPELSREQLENAVVRPAAMQEVKMSRALVRRVLSDATSMKDSLPVLQHALRRTWHKWAEQVREGKASAAEIGLEQYTAAGTAKEALDRHGKEVLDELGKEREIVVKLIFQRLTLTNADGKITRSPTSLQNLNQVVAAELGPDAEKHVPTVIERFRREDCHFLASSERELTPGSEIDVSHEAVCRVWKRLAGEEGKDPGWIPLEHKDRLAYSRLCEAAQRHRAGEGQLLDYDFLVVMERWWTVRDPKPEWAARYHVIDEVAQAATERARKAFLAVPHTGDAAEEAARKEIQRTYDAEMAAWHRVRFAATERFLRASREAKEARDAKDANAAAALRRSRVIRTWLVVALVVFTTAATVLGQYLKINQLGRDIAERKEELKRSAGEIAKLSTELRNGQEEVNKAAERVRDARQKADDAARKARAAIEDEQKAQESMRAATVARDAVKLELATVATQLTEAKRQVGEALAQNTKLRSDLSQKRAELAQKLAEFTQKLAELTQKQAELTQQARRAEDRLKELENKKSSLCAICAFRGGQTAPLAPAPNAPAP